MAMTNAHLGRLTIRVLRSKFLLCLLKVGEGKLVVITLAMTGMGWGLGCVRIIECVA